MHQTNILYSSPIRIHSYTADPTHRTSYHETSWYGTMIQYLIIGLNKVISAFENISGRSYKLALRQLHSATIRIVKTYPKKRTLFIKQP